MTDLTATVSVPVELLTRILDGKVYAPDELRALLPKPKPRLVAVDPEKWIGGSSPASTDMPDLLALLDEAVDSHTGESISMLKARIHAALGVPA